MRSKISACHIAKVNSCQVITPEYAKDHCVTLGDAAFATIDIGTSLAITSAYCIASKLSKITSNNQIPNVLQKYEDLFRP
ncbi:hypothetical protein C7974DRAFT_473751 [Boeremia exigua]|uniref:uncharacterized protein n=1 Tax=Boeremia exigua TaxID=749465 RepID=UPI001E8CF382|nr:uncharacterized protein C7974DRAFT_473751 [Boeremia exigua]KAH6622483.1 hypothetical protein C7974DRAFT_473751 [Boeremia exigua]